jgi:predicted Zn-dependent protease
MNVLRFLIPMLLVWPGLIHAELPDLGDPTKQELSPYEEHLMGKQFYQTLKSNIPFVEDLAVNDYLDTLGQKLVSQTGEPDKTYTFFILQIPSINAFAGPDAYIGIHSGLIISAQNESELAGVLAHEISHVTQRHLARAMTESKTSPAIGFATILAGILMSAQNPAAGAAIIYGGTAAMMQTQINFTRHNEYEADRVAVNVLRNAGINPEGMTNFFETLLQKAESNTEISRIEYLRTHPLSSTRIAESKHRLIESDHKLTTDSLNFQLARAKVLVESTPSLQNLIAHYKVIPASSQSPGDSYTLAIAYIAQDQPASAIPLLEQLVQKKEHAWFRMALAAAYEKNNQPELALQTYASLQQLYPNYLPLSIEHAHLLTIQGQAANAVQLMRRALQQKKHPLAYQTLAQAYFASGQIAAALEATSYQYELEGYLKLAIQQVDNAQRQINLDAATQQRLESRKTELMNQLKRERQN